MPAEPSRVRRQLGFELKRARNVAGLALRAFTDDNPTVRRHDLTPIQHPRLQRAEKGEALLSDSQLVTFLTFVEADDELRNRLEVLHAHAHSEQTRWSLALEGREHLQAVAADRERDTGLLRTVETTYLPGLLQTQAYARALLEQFGADAGRDLAAAAAARMRRQDVLYEPDRQFRFLLTERALTWPPGDVSMDAQRDRVGQLAELDAVEVRVIAPTARLPLSSFVLHEQMTDGATMVVIELEHGELVLADPADVTRYRELFGRLWNDGDEWEGR